MSIRVVLFVLVLVPSVAVAQQVPTPTDGNRTATTTSKPPNAATLAVLLANRPAQFSETEWLRMMAQPVHRSVYPLRVTREMLDSLDARALDPGYHYQMAPDR